MAVADRSEVGTILNDVVDVTDFTQYLRFGTMVVDAPTSVKTTMSPAAMSCVAVMVSVAADAPVVRADPDLTWALVVATASRPSVARAVLFVVGLTRTPFQKQKFTSRAICLRDCMTCHECSFVTGLSPPPALLYGAELAPRYMPATAALV